MLFRMKLPQNKKETVLFMFLISIIPVNIIAPLLRGLRLDLAGKLGTKF